MEKKRLDYLDMAKGIGIVLVVIAHSTFTSERVQAFITAFHMPLFFVISGMLLCHTKEEEKDFKTILKRKAKGIMIPYVSFSLLYMLIDILLYIRKQAGINWTEMYRSFIEFFTLYGISVMWFLTALFFGELLFLSLKKLWNKTGYTHVLCILTGVLCGAFAFLGITWFNASYPLYKSMPVLWLGYLLIVLFRSLAVCAFLTAGYYLHRQWLSKTEGKPGAELLLSVICMVAVLAVSKENKIVDLHFMILGNPILYYGGAILGTLAVVLFCRHVRNGRILKYLGVNSLIIMATHLDFQVLITSIDFANFMNQFITRAKVYMLYFNVALMMTLIELILIYVINRFFPFLLGKGYVRKKDKRELYEK